MRGIIEEPKLLLQLITRVPAASWLITPLAPSPYATVPWPYATVPLPYATVPWPYATALWPYATAPWPHATAPWPYATAPWPYATVHGSVAWPTQHGMLCCYQQCDVSSIECGLALGLAYKVLRK